MDGHRAPHDMDKKNYLSFFGRVDEVEERINAHRHTLLTGPHRTHNHHTKHTNPKQKNKTQHKQRHLKPAKFLSDKFGKEVLVHGRVFEGREEDTWVLGPWPTPGWGECWDREEAEIREIASIWMEGGRMSSRGRYRSGMLLCQCGHQWIPR